MAHGKPHQFKHRAGLILNRSCWVPSNIISGNEFSSNPLSLSIRLRGPMAEALHSKCKGCGFESHRGYMILQRNLNEYKINVNVEPEDDRILKYVAKVKCPVNQCSKPYQSSHKIIGKAATKAIDALRVHIRRVHKEV